MLGEVDPELEANRVGFASFVNRHFSVDNWT